MLGPIPINLPRLDALYDGTGSSVRAAHSATLIESQITTITHNWRKVCDEAEMSSINRKLFAGRQFLIAYCIDGFDNHKPLQGSFRAARDKHIAAADA